MHPAYSVIFFTTASGAGYGLLSLLLLFALLGLVSPDVWLGLTGFGLAFVLIVAGLLSSTAHLGRPERAWRAFSQWRSSWLSREGVMAVLTFAPAGIAALGWVLLGEVSGALAWAGWAAILCAGMTVYCTGMIYASLKTIRQWHHPLVALNYVVLALATGAVLLDTLLTMTGQPSRQATWTAVAALAIALALKLAYWASIDSANKSYTVGRATGLGRFGKVQPLDPPHTEPNFVMREMGYRVGRKHAARLRLIAALLGFILPAVLLAIAEQAGGAPWLNSIAVASAAAGVVVERWLFFAEAEHVVMLYYGAGAA
ncbi:MAG: DmsC/YnfH family molybdoenzyme membrane anchor subunit [Pseudomonadota bacterium]|nr:DmsC/YnfH family molybdoenzyme membrane anchor subunit [Pseudomonadota bacterium]